jgi:hypothetical protein
VKTFAEKSSSTGGDTLVTVRFEREAEEADTPVIETIFKAVLPDGVFEEALPVLVLLSTTRQDTREDIKLTKEEASAVYAKAATFIARLMSEG